MVRDLSAGLAVQLATPPGAPKPAGYVVARRRSTSRVGSARRSKAGRERRCLIPSQASRREPKRSDGAPLLACERRNLWLYNLGVGVTSRKAASEGGIKCSVRSYMRRSYSRASQKVHPGAWEYRASRQRNTEVEAKTSRRSFRPHLISDHAASSAQFSQTTRHHRAYGVALTAATLY